MSGYSIRPITLKDVDEVWNIENVLPGSLVQAVLVLEIEHNKCARYFVAEHAGTIVGYGGMWLVLDEAHITNIAVHRLPKKRDRRSPAEGING